MLRRIDRSRRLSKWLSQVSDFLAQRRGLPIVLGIALIIVSLVLQGADVFVQNQWVELVGVIAHHSGILIALIGILLIAPLGE